MAKGITIVDIAREAGVSIATVSRVLTGKARVSEKKKRVIQDLIQKYDFQPNLLARGLITSATHIIGVLAADVRNPYYASLFIACEQIANDLGYNMLLCNSFSDRVKEFELLDSLDRQRVDAIILIGGAVDSLETDREYAEKVRQLSERIPIVITGALEGAGCTQVNIDAAQAMSLVMQHIAKKPTFQKIAFAGGSQDVIFTAMLRSHWKRMLAEQGLCYYPEFDVTSPYYNENGGYAAMTEIMQHGKPDVVIAINDFTAVGVLKAVREQGLRIPEDIALISFDNTYLATAVQPQLTSVGYNYMQFGNALVSAAVQMINGIACPAETLIEPCLIARGSTESQ